MIDRASRGYDLLAPWYQWLERLSFGSALARGRTSLISEFGGADRILFLGDGDGRLLAALAKTYRASRITSVDISRRMIDLQRQRTADIQMHTPIDWIQADLLAVDLGDDQFDLIIAPFVLDCFDRESLARLIQRIDRWLAPRGRLYVVDFCLPERGIRRYRAIAWLWAMHLFFRWTTGLRNKRLIELHPLLAQRGMRITDQRRSQGGMIASTLYQRGD
jgi:ubiquinone/menaquinone biosynthesis C-methylase UbiE